MDRPVTSLPPESSLPAPRSGVFADAAGQDVTAVVVTCGDTPYLEDTLTALAAQQRPVQRVVVVDISAPGRELGSGRMLPEIVDQIFGSQARVVAVPQARTFGDAVREGLSLNAAATQRAQRRHEARTGEIPLVRDGDVAWLWLLHDDSAPRPEALAALLREAELATSIGMLGCKQRGWARPDRLLEVGIRASATTRRLVETDIDEIDQGQLDHRDDVLGVGTAGALIRRDIWEQLGGTDPALGPFNDGLELSRRVRTAGWRVVVVPTAVVHHAQASYYGLRGEEPHPPEPRLSFGARRRAQLHTWISGVPGWQVPLVYLAIAVLTLLRAAWRLVRKDLDLMGAELRAGGAIVARPGRWLATRRRTEQVRKVSRATLKNIYVNPALIREKKRELRRSNRDARFHKAAPSELELAELARLRRRRRAMLGATALVLFGLGIAILRPPTHAGVLTGGGMGRALGTLGDVWHAITSPWIDAGFGHPGPPEPFLYALLPGTLLTGNVSTVMTLALWLVIPAAGLGAWWAAGAATRSVFVRAWVALVWASAPAFVPALYSGQIGAVTAHVMLPWFALAVARALQVNARDVIESGMVGAKRVEKTVAAVRAGEYEKGTEGAIAENTAKLEEPADADTSAGQRPDDVAEPASGTDTDDATELTPLVDAPASGQSPAPRERRTNIAAAAGAAIALFFLTAGSPLLLAPLTVLLWALALITPRRRLALLLIPVPALVIHAPLLIAAGQGRWRILFTSAGIPQPGSSADLRHSALGWFTDLPNANLGPVDTGLLAIVAGAILMVLAVFALLRPGNALIPARVGWLVIAGSLALVAVARGVVVGEETASTAPAVSLILAGALLAIVPATGNLSTSLRQHNFGWQHLVLILGGMLALVVPASWISIFATQSYGTNQLRADTSAPTPALSQQLAANLGRERTLILSPRADEVEASFLRTDGPSILDSPSITALETWRPDPARASLNLTVAELVAGSNPRAAGELAAAAVAVVVVPPLEQLPEETSQADHSALIAALDSTPGLSRITVNDSGTIWRVVDATAGSAPGAASQPAQASAEGVVTATARVEDDGVVTRVPMQTGGIDTTLEAGEAGRVLILAERADPAWQATYDSVPLTRVETDWQQAFELPAHAGHVEVFYRPRWYPWWAVGAWVTAALTVILAIPLRRSEEGR